MDVPDPPSTLLLVGLLCLPCGLLTRPLTLLSLWDALSLDFELTLSLDVVLTFVRDDTLLYRLLQRFSLPAKVNVKVRPPPAWENWISAFSSYSLVLEFSPKKPTRSHSPEQ